MKRKTMILSVLAGLLGTAILASALGLWLFRSFLPEGIALEIRFAYNALFGIVPEPPPKRHWDWKADLGCDDSEIPLKNWKDSRIVAHALGNVDGLSYTNSREALIENYRRGARVFEVDLLPSREGNLVGAHDWKKFSVTTGTPYFRTGAPFDLFVEAKIDGRFTPLTFYDLTQAMKECPKIHLVTDTKHAKPDRVRRMFQELVREAREIDETILDRIVPQLYNREMYDVVESVHPFNEYIYTLYQSPDTADQVVRFVQTHPKVTAVTFWYAKTRKELCDRLREHGVKMYVHTVNDVTRFRKGNAIGVHGFYTDSIMNDDLQAPDFWNGKDDP